MQEFSYRRVANVAEALAAVAGRSEATYLAGGTGLVDLMKLGVEKPRELVDVSRLPLGQIELAGDVLRIGAMVRNSDLAYHEQVRTRLPALSQAILAGASAQLRNLATVGGNLMQKTRCYYFRDTFSPCNKREPGSGCGALDGLHRSHAVLGASDQCFATHPSDMCVALSAYDARVRVQGAQGERSIPINEFYVSYGDDPAKETVLARGELVIGVDVPLAAWLTNSHYLKVRDRESYEFALASAAVALQVEGGMIKHARVALGGVATKPWRAIAAEQALQGAKPDEAAFSAAAEAALRGAQPRRDNAFKVELAKRTLRRALQTVAGSAAKS